LISLTQQGNPVTEPNPNGTTTFAGDTWNVYVARRQGNGTKSGAILVMNNNDALTRGIWVDNDGSPNGTATAGYADWKNQVLVNVLNPAQTVTVANDGRVHLYAPARGYSVWVLQSEYTAVAGRSSIIPVDQTPATVELTFTNSIKTFPNPSAQATIEFNVAKKGPVKLEVYNADGRLLKVIANGVLDKGRYTDQFTSPSSGIYTYKYRSGDFLRIGRIVIQK
jgi:alpha-amylase